MKKNTLIAVSLLLFMATSCDQQTKPSTTSPSTTQTVSVNGDYSGIVYIDSDSLIRGYKMFKDMSAEFAVKAEKVQKELNNKMMSFEAKVKSFENKVNKSLITRYEAQQTGEQLEQERRVLMEYRNKVMGELQEKEMVMTNNISENIRLYIEKYNQVKRYKMIINTSASTSVVVAADPAIDITTDVLEGINSEYVPAKK